jgi:imidazolonepropionase-like amidohydrolase
LADVRVNGNRIVETAVAGALPVREGEDKISCRGATLMPGLIEPHAHLSFVDQATPFAFQAIPIDEHLLLTLKHAKQYLDQGFTSCFSAAASNPDEFGKACAFLCSADSGYIVGQNLLVEASVQLL